MWEIISFGDAMTMNRVFNGIAAIFQDSGYIAAGSALALFVVVATSLSSLADGKAELPYNRLFAGVMIYFVTFGQLTSVSIENRFDGTVTQVDNIPIAVAVPASLISQIGLYLAETTEAAFGMTNPMSQVTQNGYLSPLSVLASVYGETHNNACASGSTASRGMGIDLCATLPYYVQECAQVRIMRDGVASEMREVDLLAALEFNSLAHSTKVITDSGQQITMSCAGAYSLIKSASLGAVGTNMISTFNQTTNARTGETAETRVEDSLYSIQADSAKARNLLVTQMFMRSVENGTISFLNSQGRSDIAENLSSSIEQRNYGWQLQGEMWVEIVDKFIAMLEGIIYAMTPFIGLMVLTGSIGGKTVILFFQILTVFQIIPSMLVISQSIIMSDLADYQLQLASKYDVGSLLYVHSLMLEVKEQMGLGGMISATVIPAIAMALVTGSGMAVMGAMKGAAAQAKDTDATPDVAGQGGSIQDYSSLNTGKVDERGQNWGQRDTERLGTVSQSSSMDNTVKSAEKKAIEATEAYTQAASSVTTDQNGNDYTAQDIQQMGNTMMASSGSTQSWAMNQVRSTEASNSLTDTEVANVAANYSLGLKALGTGANWQENWQKGLNEQESKAMKELLQGTNSEQRLAEWKEQSQIAESKGEVLSTQNSHFEQATEKAEKALQEKETASESWESVKQLQSSLGVGNDDVKSFVNRVANDEQAVQNVKDFIRGQDDNFKSQAIANIKHYDGQAGSATNLNGDEALIAGVMLTMQEEGRLGELSDLVYSTSGAEDHQPDSKVEDGVDVSFEGKYDSTKLPVPDGNNVPTTLSNLDEEKEALIRQNELDQSAVQVAEHESGFNDIYEQFGNELNAVDIKTFENLQEVGKFLETDNLIEKVGNVVDYAKDAISGEYEDGREAYYNTAVGKAEIAALEQVQEAYGNLNDHLQEKGYLQEGETIGEAFDELVADVGDDAIELLNNMGFDIGGGADQDVNEKFEEKISNLEQKHEAFSSIATDSYISEENQQEWQSRADNVMNEIEALREQQDNYNNGEQFTLNPDSDNTNTTEAYDLPDDTEMESNNDTNEQDQSLPIPK